jgi:hypothetical protein
MVYLQELHLALHLAWKMQTQIHHVPQRLMGHSNAPVPAQRSHKATVLTAF